MIRAVLAAYHDRDRLGGLLMDITINPEEPDRTEEALLPVVDEHGVFHQDRWNAVMTSIERRSRGNPRLPAEALTREKIYQDHD